MNFKIDRGTTGKKKNVERRVDSSSAPTPLRPGKNCTSVEGTILYGQLTHNNDQVSFHCVTPC